jgi:2-oxoglutarate dehydrogenase complex dehydrogenase (E1) component-like enzyme
LEAVNPVAMGKTKAKQDEDDNINKAACIIIHGDSAIGGQGIVYETFAISGTPECNTGGVLHIICNNQIGFTTTAKQSRSCMYSSDIAKVNGVPVVHVNADSPEDVFKVAQLSIEYRQKFHKDFLIDLIGKKSRLLFNSQATEDMAITKSMNLNSLILSCIGK